MKQGYKIKKIFIVSFFVFVFIGSTKIFGQNNNPNNYYNPQSPYYYQPPYQQLPPNQNQNFYQPQQSEDDEENKNREKINTISFYSGYIEKLHTNHNLANFGLEMVNLGDLLFDKIIHCSENTFLNSALGGTVGLLALYLHIIHNVAYHEMGHALRAKAFGLNYELGVSGYVDRYTNFFGFLSSSIFKFGIGFTSPETSLSFENLATYFPYYL